MSVKKIFIMLITVVACVMIGAFVLNVIMPNFMRTAVNLVEQQLLNATGLTLDLNGDGNNQANPISAEDGDTGVGGGNVTGFQGGTGGGNP